MYVICCYVLRWRGHVLLHPSEDKHLMLVDVRGVGESWLWKCIFWPEFCPSEVLQVERVEIVVVELRFKVLAAVVPAKQEERFLPKNRQRVVLSLRRFHTSQISWVPTSSARVVHVVVSENTLIIQSTVHQQLVPEVFQPVGREER